MFAFPEDQNFGIDCIIVDFNKVLILIDYSFSLAYCHNLTNY